MATDFLCFYLGFDLELAFRDPDYPYPDPVESATVVWKPLRGYTGRLSGRAFRALNTALLMILLSPPGNHPIFNRPDD